MSYWGHFLLRNCDNDLTICLDEMWFFPSEVRQILSTADAIKAARKARRKR